MSNVSRRSFVTASAALGLGTLAGKGRAAALGADSPSTFPHQDPEQVRAIVGASHANFDKVKELVEKCPPLARASWDWGFGDWETALGAASHVGRRDIAQYLMSHGARPDIFTFAMLGDVDTLKAMVKAQPGVQRILGPHGITLLQHAKNGGKESAAAAAYLETLGDAGNAIQDLPLNAEQLATYAGTYRLDDSEVVFVIKDIKGRLAFQRGEESPRFLTNHGEHVFSAVGSSEVRLTFAMKDGRAASVSGVRHTSDFKASRAE